jgi:hypothetical protein
VSGPQTTATHEPQQAPEPKEPTSVQRGLGEGLERSPWMKALIYSSPGAGKTVLGATAPEPVILDTENSTETLGDWPELEANCMIRRMLNWNDLGPFLEKLRLRDDEYADRKTVVVDTVTELRYRNLDTILTSDDKFTPKGPDYQRSGEMMRRLMVSIRDLPMHVIVMAHAVEIEVNGSIVVRPSLPPKLYDTLKGVFGLQAFLYVTDEGWDEDRPFQNALQTRQTKVVQAKTRYRHLPPVIENPTWPKIMQLTGRYNEQGEML